MHKKGTKLTDLVDFKRLQLLQDNFSQSTGLTSIILDENGNAITRISRPNAFSQLVESVEHAGDGCLCFTSLGGIRSKTDDPLTYTCPYSGFTTVYVPVLHQGEHIASWGLLQARIGETDEDLIHKTATDFGRSEDDVRCAVENSPVFSQQDVDKAVASLQALIRGLIKTVPDEIPALEFVAGDDQGASVQRTMQLLNKFMSSDTTGMLVCDYETGEILTCNSLYAQWIGVEREDAVGKTPDSFENQDFDTCVNVVTTDTMLDENGVPAEPYQWNDYSAAHSAWLRCENQLVYWQDGHLAHLITFRDITDERRMQDELSRLAYYDRQMNLPNGLKLTNDLDLAFLQAGARDEYLICFDITSLRKLNDAHGRKAGDAFLRTVTKWIGHQSLPGSVLYRVEGDAFCLRLSGVSIEETIDIAQRIFDRFGDLWSLAINGQQISIMSAVSLSVIGVDSLDEGDELLTIMQRTLDISRKEKKVIIYDEETDRELKSHIQTQLNLKKCIKQNMNGFDVFFQPIVEPTTGTWKGLEALCRWTSPEIGAVPPLIFIREAEQLGLINLIGEWVLETSIRYCKGWGLDTIDGFFLSVNLSPVQIMSTTLINSTMNILNTYNYPGNKLSLEVTESTKLNFDDHTLGVIDKLRAHGIMISLDDFGTGYSSFNNMKNLPVRFVKTDHSFIKGIEQDYFMQYFYHIITELAHKTGMKLVVEGVETVEQLEIMMKNGVDYIQGYYFGRPMPASEMEGKLENFRTLNPPQVAGRLEDEDEDLGGQESYLITTNTFKMQTRCMQLLMGETDVEKACNEVLEIVGTHFNTRHAFLYQREASSLLYSHAYEWAASGVNPHKQALKQLDTEEMYASWMHYLRKKGMLVSGNVHELKNDIAGFLSTQEVESIAVVPVRDPYTKQMLGFIGIDDNKFRNWLPEEIILLKNVGLMVASLLHQHQLRQSAGTQTGADIVLDHMDMPVFVSELETDRILWSNRRLREACGEETIAGKPCYTVMHGCDDRCEDCHAKLLLNDPSCTEVCHEYENKEDGTSWLVHNALIPWEGDIRAQMEYAVDITGIKKAQKQLEYLASTDALSGVKDRNSLVLALPKALQKAKRRGLPLSLAVVQVDANSVPAMGEVLQAELAEGDILGRVGETEFVLLQEKTSDETVALLTEAALALRGNSDGEDAPQFLFGVVENTELPYEAGNRYIRNLFDVAEKRMHAFAGSDAAKVPASAFKKLFSGK